VSRFRSSLPLYDASLRFFDAMLIFCLIKLPATLPMPPLPFSCLSEIISIYV